MIVGIPSIERYSLSIRRKPKKFIRELRELAIHVNILPNSLGHNDKHKISHAHKQLTPSMLGKIDVYATSKDVGQTGMISPYANLYEMNHSDVNKYPSIKFELYKFINEEFPNARSVRFNATNIKEFNLILDNMVTHAYINLNYKVPKEISVTTQDELEEKAQEKKRKAQKRNK